LWESISCPFEDQKQEHGEQLKIIGFWVNINLGTISIPPASIMDVVAKIQQFLETTNRRPRLGDWQHLASHLNWVLNVLPWWCPALSELYHKMSGKVHTLAGMHINVVIHSDLTWLASKITRSIGIHITGTGKWVDGAADIILWTDASLRLALLFVYAGNGFVYQLHLCPPGNKIDICFLELMAILSAIHHIALFDQLPHQILLFTDSLDSVAAFNSLGVSETLHNGPLLGVASIVLHSGVDIHVHHISGKDNLHADLLSHLLFDEYKQAFPTDCIHTFEPPQELLPV
jgi:hypothetical protein